MSVMLNYLSNFIPLIQNFISKLFKKNKNTIKISIIDKIYENDNNVILNLDDKIDIYRIQIPIQILMEPDEVFWTTINKIYIVNTFSKLRAIELIKDKYRLFMLEEHKNIGNPDFKYIDKREFKLDDHITNGISYVDNPLKFRNNFFNYIEKNTEIIT